ncbi:MAG: hypothetical protein K6A44_04800 [bacterium]|nr:hypothetical protein [bacterium]
MKKIICYGDSNTFGFNPKDNSRFDEETRWTSILQKNLGSDYEVINEGMCDRTGFVNNPKGFLFSASKHYPKFIAQTNGIDFLILWVGTNDLQFQYNISIGTIEKGLRQLIDLAQEKVKNIIIVSPVILDEKVLEGFFSFQFNEESIVKSRKIGRIFRQISNANHCVYFDVNKIVTPSDIDGLHYDKKGHKLIGEKLAELIKTQFRS